MREDEYRECITDLFGIIRSFHSLVGLRRLAAYRMDSLITSLGHGEGMPPISPPHFSLNLMY